MFKDSFGWFEICHLTHMVKVAFRVNRLGQFSVISNNPLQ